MKNYEPPKSSGGYCESIRIMETMQKHTTTIMDKDKLNKFNELIDKNWVVNCMKILWHEASKLVKDMHLLFHLIDTSGTPFFIVLPNPHTIVDYVCINYPIVYMTVICSVSGIIPDCSCWHQINEPKHCLHKLVEVRKGFGPSMSGSFSYTL